MTHASVFSGIGGPEVAATMLGWQDGKQIPIIEGWYMYGDHGSKDELARNDGLTLQDWQDWFKSHEQDTVESDPMAIIHFTKFRY